MIFSHQLAIKLSTVGVVCICCVVYNCISKALGNLLKLDFSGADQNGRSQFSDVHSGEMVTEQIKGKSNII